MTSNRHRSIVEEAIHFARANREVSGSRSSSRQRPKSGREKPPATSYTKDSYASKKSSSDRESSRQSVVVTDDEKSSSRSYQSDDGDMVSVPITTPKTTGKSRNFGRRLDNGMVSKIVSPQASSNAKPVAKAEENPPGCYLVYYSDSGGRLTLHYSKEAVANAIGFWHAGNGKTIQGFKFRQNAGRVELIKGIAGGDANKRKFFSGWCQFVKAAVVFSGSIRKFPNNGGLEVDLYAHCVDGSVLKLDIDDASADVTKLDAIACVPKHKSAFQGINTLDLNRFVNSANIAGAALPL